MAIPIPQYLYLLDEDLHRLGNATTSRLDNVRQNKDVDTYERNGVLMVVPNGKGISLVTEERLTVLQKRNLQKGSWVWKLPASFPMPSGLALHPDTERLRPGQPPEHYFLCPQSDMPLSEYVGLLSKLALRFERTRKL